MIRGRFNGGVGEGGGGGRGIGGGRGAHPSSPSYFLQSLVFCNHFEELKTMLSEVELIINNALSTYVYLNTIEKCLAPNYLYFCIQLV